MKIISCLSFFWLYALLTLNATALIWSPTPKDGEAFYACITNEVTMAWSYTLQEGDVVNSIVWNFAGRSQEMVAFYAQGHFIVLPSFAQRVRFVPNAGIALSNVLKGDSGNYSVTVIGHDGSGTSFEMHRTVLLQVSDALMTTDHELHAHQQGMGEFSNLTHQFHAVLTCGLFTFIADPPVSVEWLTPEGLTLPSTVYSNGLFKLYIPNPVTAGTYTCRFSPASVNKTCSHGQDQQASVEVRGIEVRLTLMEATQHQLRADLAEKSAIIDQLHADLQAVKEHTPPAIAFSARLSYPSSYVGVNQPMVLTDVMLNQGDAYNSSTGMFTAPLSATYYFSAFATGSFGRQASLKLGYNSANSSGDLFSFWASSNQQYQSGSLQGAVHLNKGEQVWLLGNTDSYIPYGISSAFSGFLLFVD